MEYIQNIKRIRKKLGLTQEDMAGPGLSRSMISLIESGRSVPSLKTLKLIAAKLGVPMKELMDDASQNHDEKTVVSDDIIEKRLSICRALVKAKKLDEAEKLLQDTARLSNHNMLFRGLLLKEQGTIAYARQAFAKATEAFEEATLYITSDQTKVLIETYCQLAEAYRHMENYPLVIENALYEHILLKTKDIEADPLLQLKCFYNLAYGYCRQKDFKRGIDIINEALKLMKSVHVTYREGHFYMLKGLSESYLGKHREALKSNQSALSIFEADEEGKYQREMTGCLVNMGIDYRSLKKFNQSYSTLTKSYKLTKNNQEQSSYALKNISYELSLTLFSLEEYEEALNWVNKGLDIESDDSVMNGKLTYVAALIHLHRNDWPAADRAVDKAYSLLKGNAYLEAKCQQLKGAVLLKEGRPLEAYKIADEAIGKLLIANNRMYFEE